MARRGPPLDVLVVGDGPAGLALASACARSGLLVAALGPGAPWTATYGMWRDEVDLPPRCFQHIVSTVVVQGRRRHALARPYAIVDDESLRTHLADGVDVAVGRAERVQHFAWGTRVVTGAAAIDARIVVDASGRAGLRKPGAGTRGAPTAWQTAYGVVLDEPPPRFDRAAVTLMDLRPLPGGVAPPTFCYVVPVADGWLVEETVLAARRAVDPAALRQRLVARLGAHGDERLASARRVDVVTIPMGGRLPDRRDQVVAFGAAAGYTHPASGYSVAASLRAAPRVAAALAAACAAREDRPDLAEVWAAVWPASARRSRRLHNYGLEVLLRLDANGLAAFFDAFFDLDEDVWAPYLRIDTAPGDVSRAMTGVLRRLPWALRRRLLGTPFWKRPPVGC